MSDSVLSRMHLFYCFQCVQSALSGSADAHYFPQQVKEKLAYQQEKRMERKLPMRLNEAQLKTVNSVLADE